MGKYCIKCGKKLNDEDIFCGGCGAKQINAETLPGTVGNKKIASASDTVITHTVLDGDGTSIKNIQLKRNKKTLIGLTIGIAAVCAIIFFFDSFAEKR